MRFNKFFNCTPAPGEVGIEVEVEGHRLPPFIGPEWIATEDGSLRGESREYIFRVPQPRSSVEELMHQLHSKLTNNRTLVYTSERTSVHVHVNAQDMTVVQAFNYILLYLIYENALVHYCGEAREGNHFCLRADDADYLIDFIERVVESGNFAELNTNMVRYASINLSALSKFGSLEFRAMRGTIDPDIICKWTNLLLRLKDAALRFKTPLDIVYEMSGTGLNEFTESIFGEHVHVVTDFQDWDRDVWKKLRKLQSIAYSGDWDNFSFLDEPEEDI